MRAGGSWSSAAGVAAATLALTTCSSAPDELSRRLNSAECGSTVEITEDVLEDVNVYKECPADNRIHVIGVGEQRPLITGETQYALRYSGSGFIFEHLEFTTQPKECDVRNRVIFGNGRNMDFVDVVIRDGGYDGFGTYCDELGQATNIRLIDSEVMRNGLGCLDGEVILNGDGVDYFGCIDCEIAGSYIHGNNNYQVQIKGGARGVTVRDSVIDSSSQYGFMLGKPGNADSCMERNAEDVVLTGNVIRMRSMNGWPLWIYETVNMVIEHNTVVLTEIVKSELNPDQVNGGYVLVGNDLTGEFGATVRNNIFVNDSVALYEPIYYGQDEGQDLDLSGLDMNHNLFFDRENPPDAPLDGAESSLVGDPGFVDFPDDLSLSDASPAIDAGEDVGAPFDGAAPDLGAFERGEDGGVPPDPGDPPPGALGMLSSSCSVSGERDPAAPLALLALLAWASPLCSRRFEARAPRVRDSRRSD